MLPGLDGILKRSCEQGGDLRKQRQSFPESKVHVIIATGRPVMSMQAPDPIVPI